MPLAKIGSGIVLFVHVPKCAGTSVEAYLSTNFGPLALRDTEFNSLPPRLRWTRTSPQHADAASLKRLFPPGFLGASFAIVRHPVPRMVSVFRFQRDIERSLSPDTQFEDWLRSVVLPPRKPWAFDNHIRSMTEMVPEDATVFRLEDGWDPVIDWLQRLSGPDRILPRTMPERNVLARRLAHERREAPPVVPGPEACALIARAYADDFQRFGYDPGGVPGQG